MHTHTCTCMLRYAIVHVHVCTRMLQYVHVTVKKGESAYLSLAQENDLTKHVIYFKSRLVYG